MLEWYHCTANQPFSILLYWLLIKGNSTKKRKVEEKRKNQIDGRKQKQKREKRRERQQRKKKRITPERKQKEETILLPRESNKVKKPLLKYAAAPILPLNDRKNGNGSNRLPFLLGGEGGQTTGLQRWVTFVTARGFRCWWDLSASVAWLAPVTADARR